jgi:uncharacterized BrkB/YihY/UPF0761 family membrane protein
MRKQLHRLLDLFLNFLLIAPMLFWAALLILGKVSIQIKPCTINPCTVNFEDPALFMTLAVVPMAYSFIAGVATKGHRK